MKVGDLVILEYKGVDHEEKDTKKIGIVKDLAQFRNELAKVLWSSGDQQWQRRRASAGSIGRWQHTGL